ncbi:PulJ/GspJ family protein [Pseudomonas peli]|uniref:PulJ/GspJ family protein n=1 Tax=Pseudomonas peli TaxID=592361 RepID=UPI002858E2B9|nr:type II secretion system protein [Pseudomonas peli]MDR7025374.1 MSHA biogenesis protein MshO [Pseudomonas peli]
MCNQAFAIPPSGAHASRGCDERGFTLVELIMVIALSALVAVLISSVLSNPLQGFVDQSRRAALVDLASGALNRMARDVRLAVPNTLRTPNGQTVELLAIHEAGRYRANLAGSTVRHDPPRCPPSPQTCEIDVLSPGMTAARVADARWMVLYNIGMNTAGDSVWPPFNSSNAATPAVVTPNGVGFAFNAGVMTLSGAAASGFRFKFASPQRRFYLAREVLGYHCDNPGTDATTGHGTGVIRRASFTSLASSYTYGAGNSSLLVDSVSRCTFTYEPGTNTRGALLTLRLGVKRQGEEIMLMQQVHVDNAP